MDIKALEPLLMILSPLLLSLLSTSELFYIGNSKIVKKKKKF